MDETVEEIVEETEKVSKVSGLSYEEAIKKTWAKFERRQCELIQETGIALSDILGNKHYQ